MASREMPSVVSERTSHSLTTALASAVLEWLLIFMLFVDAIFSYLVTKFARYCKLQTPCLLCSRLDHVLGSQKLKFYWDLVCGNHKLEISSLVYCHAHNKLVDVHGMCESCLFSFATINKSNAETYRLLVGKLGDHPDYHLDENPLLDNHNHGHRNIRYCSCCNDPWMPQGYSQKLIQVKLAGSEASELDIPLSGYGRHNQADCKKYGNVSVSVTASSQRKSKLDPLSYVGYTEVNITSDTESEVSNDANENGASAQIYETDDLKEDVSVQYVQQEPRIITLSNDLASEKLIDPVSAPGRSLLFEHGFEELNWQEASNKSDPSALSQLISLDGVPPSSNASKAPVNVSKESSNLVSFDDVPQLSNANLTPINVSKEKKLTSFDSISPSSLSVETHFQVSEENKLTSLIGVPPSSIASETPIEVSKEDKLAYLDDVPPSVNVVEASKESCITRTVEVEDKIMTKSEEIFEARGEPVTNQMPIEKNHVVNDNRAQVSNLLELGDAYKLAVGSRGRQLSGVLPEHWFGKDSSRLSEDLKILLSQLSAARSIEQAVNDVSPRVSINSDEIKASDLSTLSGMKILQRRASLERNESGLSLDGSIVSEIEGESVVDWLKRQVEHDRKLLNALYKELEEERNASAIAANQAMAMITRLQEEKATFQMEALQNLRMMEEQAEYDMEALQQTNDLLAEKEKEIQDLEAELEFYRNKFPNESLLDGIMEVSCKRKERESIMDHTSTNSIKEGANVHTDSVREKPNIYYKAEDTDSSSARTMEDCDKQ